MDTHPHYRCELQLIAEHRATTQWATLPQVIRGWIGKRLEGRWESNQAFGGKWFYIGGEWKPPRARGVLVKTAMAVGTGDETAPEFWAVRFEHPCDDVAYRQWRTDVAITIIKPGIVGFSLQTSHYLLPGFVGDEPAPPASTAPRLVTCLLDSPGWRAFAGSERLSCHPVPVQLGEGASVVERIMCNERRCPIVLISRELTTDQPKLDPSRLAWRLSGLAAVYVPATNEASNEMDSLLNHEYHTYRCWDGMVRIYQPVVRPDIPTDCKRHRFFTRDVIDSAGDEAVESIIIRSLVRGSPLHRVLDVASVDDIASKQRQLRLAELRADAEGGSAKGEWITLLEQENGQIYTTNRSLERQIQEMTSEKEGLDFTMISLQKNTERLQREKTCLSERLTAQEGFFPLPRTLPEVIELIERFHAGRIAFTDQARKSAKESKLADIGIAWRCLWSMATELYDLKFSEQASGDIAREFKDRTGFDLALTDGSMTRKDGRLMASRRQMYDGTEICIESHVKFGAEDPKLLRVHFCAEQERQLLIVGHCGGHLQTSGSRRRR